MRHFVLALLLLAGAVTLTRGQAANWYPSRWGAADQRGAANRITPAKVLEAKNLISRGTVYQLGHVYESGMPMFGTRHFSLRIPQAFGPQGSNKTVFHDEIVSGELGQVGTQFDGLGHLGIGDLFYNGNNRHDFAKAEGLTKLGIENVGAIVTRGVLVDVAGYKGVPRLQGGYEITLADLQGALKRQKTDIKSGDIVLLHTGWGSLWLKDNAAFGKNAPGIGLAAARFLVEREVVMVGSDTWAMEVVPNPDAQLAFPVHQLFLARYKDGTTEIERIPAQVWRLNENRVVKTFIKNKEVTSIKLDPYKETADINDKNNSWNTIPEPSKFTVFKGRMGGARGGQTQAGNPMQKAAEKKKAF